MDQAEKIKQLEAKVKKAEKFAREGRRALGKKSSEDYRSSQRELMRRKRAADMEITVRKCANQKRRDKALNDPNEFIKTYFADRFFMQNAPHHQSIARLYCNGWLI